MPFSSRKIDPASIFWKSTLDRFSVAAGDTQRRRYPELATQPITHRWVGQVAIARDRLPRLFALAPAVLANFGCNGKSVAWCTAIGAVLADAFTGADSESLPLPVTRLEAIPLHALRLAHVAIGSAWLKLHDALQHPQTMASTR